MLDFLWTNEILRLFYISIGVQWVGCTLAVLLHTEKFYDLTGIVVLSLMAVKEFILLQFLGQKSSK